MQLMHDDYIQDNLQSVFDSIEIIQKRIEVINKADDFVSTPAGAMILDSIAMRLQVIGESLKNIDKVDPSYLLQFKTIEWEKIIKMRDLISHHYDTVNPEVVYDICLNHLPVLKSTITDMLKEFNK